LRQRSSLDAGFFWILSQLYQKGSFLIQEQLRSTIELLTQQG
jgi:hypothetical protein